SLLSCAILRIVYPSASFALVDFGFVCGVVAAIGCPLPFSSLGTQRVFFSFRLVRKRHGFFRRPCGHLPFLFLLITIWSKPQLDDRFHETDQPRGPSFRPSDPGLDPGEREPESITPGLDSGLMRRAGRPE